MSAQGPCHKVHRDSQITAGIVNSLRVLTLTTRSLFSTAKCFGLVPENPYPPKVGRRYSTFKNHLFYSLFAAIPPN